MRPAPAAIAITFGGLVGACGLLADLDDLSGGADAGDASDAGGAATDGGSSGSLDGAADGASDASDTPPDRDGGPTPPGDAGCTTTTVMRLPSSATSGAGGGSSWSALTDALQENGVGARVSLGTGVDTEQSRQLVLTDFGFDLAPTATIRGVTVRVRRKASLTNEAAVHDSEIRLSVDGQPSGENRASASLWTTGFISADVGGPSDLWGLTLTPTALNAPGFGVYFRVINDGATTASAEVDAISVIVTACQ